MFQGCTNVKIANMSSDRNLKCDFEALSVFSLVVLLQIITGSTTIAGSTLHSLIFNVL